MEDEIYDEVGNIDTPINTNNTPELLKALISNDSIPSEIRHKHWEVFNNDLTLSFQDEGTKRLKMMDFDLMKIDNLLETPWYEYTFETEALWNKLRLVFETKLERATGFKTGGRINERLVQQTQFGEQKVVRSMDAQGGSGSLIASMLGRGRR